MIRLLKRIIKSEAGQALPIVLALLVLGGLAIIPSLNYISTSLESGRSLKTGIKGIYAADAGIENVLWCLENSTTPVTELSETINQGNVSIETIDHGPFTLYFGELVQMGVHGEYLSVHGEIEWDGGAGAYKYTITVTWEPGGGTPTIHLVEVGARLPLGYSYQEGSAAEFGDNLSEDEPDETYDAEGAQLINWVFGTPLPSVSSSNPVEKQQFYLEGSGELDGDYAWVVANREDIGAVGEISGTLYTITATATDAATSQTTAQIVADIIEDSGITYVIQWQVSN
jgi:hypothetical protein